MKLLDCRKVGQSTRCTVALPELLANRDVSWAYQFQEELRTERPPVGRADQECRTHSRSKPRIDAGFPLTLTCRSDGTLVAVVRPEPVSEDYAGSTTVGRWAFGVTCRMVGP